jgi:hypothetical protein
MVNVDHLGKQLPVFLYNGKLDLGHKGNITLSYFVGFSF